LTAYARGMPQHESARAWLDERLNGVARVGLSWGSLTAFVRLVTSPRVFERPATVPAAWAEGRDLLCRLFTNTPARATRATQ
jgi:predicted nucleic acid-binding protein